MKIIRTIILLTALAGFFSCSKTGSDVHPEALEAVSVTQWTESMELFMEYDPLLAGKSIKFIIHLTILDDFQPIREGRVRLSFRYDNGKTITEETDQLLREGIFTPQVVLPEAGHCLFSLEYTGEKAKESFSIGSVTVFASESDIPHAAETSGGSIVFLKEQQWKTRFSTEAVRQMQIRPSVTAMGFVKPKQESFAYILSPVSGILSVSEKTTIAVPGQRVSQGDVLAVLTPPLKAENTWTEMYLNFQRAEKDYNRALRLKETGSVSQREFEAIEQTYLGLKAGYESLAGKLSSDHETLRQADGRFLIRAPFEGIVSDVWVYPGQKVDADEKLMSIVNPEKVWVHLNLYEKDYYGVREVDGLSIQIPGLDNEIHVTASSMRIIARSETMNPVNRTIPMLIEVANRNQALKIGQSITVRLYKAGGERSLAVHRNALFEDQGHDVVFVQTEGESFEKRFVETGATYLDYVAVETGLNEGDRIVTQGGYMVKLAGTSEVIGHAHTH